MNSKVTRTYTSALRERQAAQTQDLILDALTDLLADKRADEITTREIAERADVSQPTVYRHFPDRQALLEGLASRLSALGASGGGIGGLDEFGPMIRRLFAVFDEHAIETTAEALANADPRQFAKGTLDHSKSLVDAVAAEFETLAKRDHLRFAALLRCLGSAQTWLRLREEFGLSGEESGSLVAWAIATLIDDAKRAGLPD